MGAGLGRTIGYDKVERQSVVAVPLFLIVILTGLFPHDVEGMFVYY